MSGLFDVRFFEGDQNAERFAAMIGQVGHGLAVKAYVRAMNHEGAKARTQVVRSLTHQTSIPRGIVVAGTRLVKATPGDLRVKIEATGKELPLSKFGVRQFAYGTRAKVWGKFQTFKGTFVVGRYGGNAFHRTSKTRGPIQGLYGPALGKEIVRDETAKLVQPFAEAIAERAVHELDHLMAM